MDKTEVKIPNLFLKDNFSLKMITENMVLNNTIAILFIPKTKLLFILNACIEYNKKKMEK